MTQTRAMSVIESVTNVLVGFAIAVLTQYLVFPMFGIYASLADNLVIGIAFTAVSFVRSYILRRLFNR